MSTTHTTRGGRRYSDANYIRLRVPANPKRPGSAAHQRFGLYRSGQRVADYLSAGGTRADVRYDSRRGYVRLTRRAPSTQH